MGRSALSINQPGFVELINIDPSTICAVKRLHCWMIKQ